MRPNGWMLPGLLMAALMALPVASGCSTPLRAAKTAEEYQEEARHAYAEGVEAYVAEDWELAVRLFSDLKRDYSYTRYARLAELRLADIAFRQERFAEAIAAYKAYAHDYPTDPEVPYARYRITRALFMQSESSILQPPLEERDLASVQGAYAALREFLRDFPEYPRRVELDYMLEVVTGVLVRHELYVARFYLGRDLFQPAIARVEYALTKYGPSELEPEAMTLLGETYLKMKDREKAAAAFRRVLSDYPASPFAVPATRFLHFMGQGS
jgi:outer membrane protein assembly factor BamD